MNNKKKQDPSEKRTLLSEKRTHLAQKRTELAHERTLMGYVRTATTLVLFGVAFFGFSKAKFDFFFITGILAIAGGLTFVVLAIIRSMKHAHEIRKISEFFGKIIHHTYNKDKK